MPIQEKTERNAAVLRMFYENHTCEDIAAKISLTRERIRQIIKQAGFSVARQPRRIRQWDRPRTLRLTSAERFWGAVDKSGGESACWPWQRKVFRDKMYGHVYFRGKYWSSHTLAFYLGYRRKARQWVLHDCGNYLCCNPKHLYEGTPQNNADDRLRHAIERGVYNPPPEKPKYFTHTRRNEAIQIKQLASDGNSTREIAKITGRSIATINRIRYGHAQQDVVVEGNNVLTT
jgi:DNA-binding CsgD family transcriptional regulator